MDTREELLAQARALLAQKQLEFIGAEHLAKKGYQGKVQLATAKAALKEAQAQVARWELEIEHTLIRAPYPGMLQSRSVELGSLVQPGGRLGEFIELNPLVIRADVPELEMAQIKLGEVAEIRFADGSHTQGKVRYISGSADVSTHLFRIEVAIDNRDWRYRAGMSAEVKLPLNTLDAIHISPALLALADDGEIGVMSVESGLVKFTPVSLVQADADGVWVSGMHGTLEVITVGQGFVLPGEQVEVISTGKADEPKTD